MKKIKRIKFSVKEIAVKIRWLKHYPWVNNLTVFSTSIKKAPIRKRAFLALLIQLIIHIKTIYQIIMNKFNKIKVLRIIDRS